MKLISTFRIICYLLSIGMLCLCSCSPNPVTGKNEFHVIPEKTEIDIGTASYTQMQQVQGGPFVADPDLTRYIRRIGRKIAQVSDRPHLPYEFVIINDPTANAWALPGGKIAIHRGLLLELESEAELAAVLGHEIVHAAARHSAKQIERSLALQGGIVTLAAITGDKEYGDYIIGSAAIGAQLLSLKYSRSAELEADKYGIHYMVNAGYNPRAAIQIQEMFLRISKGKKSGWLEGLLATHSPSQERIEENKKTVASFGDINGFNGYNEYQHAISTLKNVSSAYSKLDTGKKALANKQAIQALEIAQKAISIFPKEALFYHLKAQAFEQLGKIEEALINYDQAIALNSQYYDFFLKRGLLKHRLGQIESAKTDLENSIALLPTGEAHEELGNIYLAKNSFVIAIKHYKIASVADSPSGKRARAMLIKLEAIQNPLSKR